MSAPAVQGGRHAGERGAGRWRSPALALAVLAALALPLPSPASPASPAPPGSPSSPEARTTTARATVRGAASRVASSGTVARAASRGTVWRAASRGTVWRAASSGTVSRAASSGAGAADIPPGSAPAAAAVNGAPAPGADGATAASAALGAPPPALGAAGLAPGGSSSAATPSGSARAGTAAGAPGAASAAGAPPPPVGAQPPPLAPAVTSRGVRVQLADGVVARLSGDGQISIEAVPRRGEALASFTQRLCGDARLAPQVLEANHLTDPASGAGGRRADRTPREQRLPTRLLAGRTYRLPLEILAPAWQLKAVQALFPGDRVDPTGWRHQARGLGPLRRENLWQLSEWFTGKGENFRAVREYNNLHDEDVARGAVLTIPSELLRPSFGAALPVPEKPFTLAYGKDEKGDYAIYRLRPGEALYSGVVVRFTGRIYAADVNALAAEIAQRSGIADVTAIPVGFKVKIPLDLLQPEFLPEGDPRRREYEAGLRASSQFSNQVRARGLEGITVILDAGHGGHDSGAEMDGVWESLYVYDIAVRLKRLLETHTAAAVRLTTRDGDDFRVVDSDVLPNSRGHAVLTSPPYPIEDPVVGVNLRWYLANSYFRRALSADNDPQKVVFLSIHADSLHPSLRGATAYIPAARMRDESYGKHGAVYESRQEFRESPRVEFPWDQRVQSEGLSRQLAKQVIGAFEERGLPVHPFSPVRDHIIRNRGEWVPAVLRYNSVPAKMLLEVCNINNGLDRRLLQTRSYRQHVAEAVLDGLLAYYGESASQPPAVRVARSSH